MIARALLLEIKFLVADEIISMLDASTRIDVLNLLGDLKERGVGILFITHDLSLGNYISRQDPDPATGQGGRDGRHREGLRQARASVHADAPGVGPHLTERWEPRSQTPTAADDDGDLPLVELEADHFAAVRGDA